MAPTFSDCLLQRLYDWGVRQIYGYPGDGINGIMGALDRASDKLKFIQSRQPQGYWRGGSGALTNNATRCSWSAAAALARYPSTIASIPTR